MSKKKTRMVRLQNRNGWERYVVGNGFGTMKNEFDADTSTVFDEQGSGTVPTKSVIIKGKPYTYVKWGDDDQMPYKMRNKVGDCMITAQSMQTNTLTCYGGGLKFSGIDGGIPMNEDFKLFSIINHLNVEYLEMCTDMQMYYFTVVCLILSNDGKKIVHIHHKEAQNCRFQYNMKHVLYGNFEEGSDQKKDDIKGDDIEVIPLLDINHPEEDLLQRMGRMPGRNGKEEKGKDRKFAMVLRFPTIGYQYYPRPNWISVLRDKWYDIYSLIGEGKRTKIKNATAPRFQIEIHSEYWERLCNNEGITDPEKIQERIKKEKENIEGFVTGLKNSGKTWITEYYVDPNGKECRMVRVLNLEDGKKEGGDWADDIQEAANMLCFAFGVHPNLVGATPGKSAMNNSGSDKRELFTLKQVLEIAFRDIMLHAFELPLYYNGWYSEIKVEAPIVQLTTLDEGKDMKETNTITKED